MKKILLTFFAAALLFSTSPMAETQTRYLVSLPDIPLMPQMQELKDSGVVFDKAEGRIVEESVRAPNMTEEQVRKFYNETLPALGWKQINPQRFLRNGEQLTVNLEKLGDKGLVKFSVSPSQP